MSQTHTEETGYCIVALLADRGGACLWACLVAGVHPVMKVLDGVGDCLAVSSILLVSYEWEWWWWMIVVMEVFSARAY